MRQMIHSSSKIHLHSGLYYKSFMILIYDRNDSTIVIYDHNDSTIVIYDRNDSTIVIYDRNDSGLYYKTTIVARCELKLCSKLKCNLRSYNCNLWS